MAFAISQAPGEDGYIIAIGHGTMTVAVPSVTTQNNQVIASYTTQLGEGDTKSKSTVTTYINYDKVDPTVLEAIKNAPSTTKAGATESSSSAAQPSSTGSVTEATSTANSTRTSTSSTSKSTSRASRTGSKFSVPTSYNQELLRDSDGWVRCVDNACSATSAPKSKSITGPAAAAGVLGGLFLITLGALIFFFCRRKRGSKKVRAVSGASSYHDHGDKVQFLETQLADRDEQLAAVQAKLLNSGNRVTTMDDKTIKQRFEKLFQDIKDLCMTHYRSDHIALSPELRELLEATIPNYETMLQQSRTKSFVVRSAIAYLLQNAVSGGDLVAGGSIANLERSIKEKVSENEYNEWRAKTYSLVSRSVSSHEQSAAIEGTTNIINDLLLPLAGGRQSTERYRYLYRIVENVAALSLDLGKQYARVQWLQYDKIATRFGCESMDDVLQEHETTTARGKASNPLDGRPVQAVIFPGVVKWGSESGANYGDMTVLIKSKVLA